MNENTQITKEILHNKDCLLLHLKGVLHYTEF